MFAWLAVVAAAQDGVPPAAPLVIGTHPVAPFVIHDPDGGWSGISIDLWKHLAEELHLTYEIRELEVKPLVTNADGAVDVAVSLNIAPSTEETYDMTHAFLSTGLAIAVRPQTASVWTALGRVLTPSFLAVAGGVAVLLVGAGSVMWLVERRDAEGPFAGSDGWLSGLFWAIETVIGYNDPAHQTRLGRTLGIAWAGFGVIVVSTLTAQLSSQLTISGLETAIAGPDDLPRVTVGTVDPSAGLRYCNRHGLTCRGYPDAEAALAGMVTGEVDAVVYEAPILAYHANRRWPDDVLVLPGTFDNHGYGFGLKAGSPLREQVDRALLRHIETDAFRELLAEYLGAGS
ncbi:MAG: transporter substrate-binding domain-containing protein [Myxococcota bacterium]